MAGCSTLVLDIFLMPGSLSFALSRGSMEKLLGRNAPQLKPDPTLTEGARVKALVFTGGAHAVSRLVALPSHLPLLLKKHSVPVEDLLVLPGIELRKGSLAKVVDEAVLRCDDSQSGFTDSH